VSPKSLFRKWLHINQTEDPEYQLPLKTLPKQKLINIIKFPKNVYLAWVFGQVLCLKWMHFKMKLKKKIIEKLYNRKGGKKTRALREGLLSSV